MDNFIFAMEKSYDYMVKEVKDILASTIYSENERKRLFYACGACLHAILDLAERVEVSEDDKKYISAFRFANNALKHDKSLFEITEQTGGLRFPIRFPIRFPAREISWKAIEDNGKYKSQHDNYVIYLMNKPIIETCKKTIEMLLQYTR